MNSMTEFADAQLLVMGDCMSQFFGGHDGFDNSLPDLLTPAIRTKHLGSITAWSLMEETSSMGGRRLVISAIDELNQCGFSGWLMLSFGYADLNCHVMKHALRDGIVAAVRNTVDRYVEFIDQMKLKYGRLAIWGPPPTTPREMTELYESHHHEAPRFGTDRERNYATMLFNTMIAKALGRRGIPFLSLFDAAILANGQSNPKYLYDGCKFGQAMMPLALDLLEQRLGVHAPRDAYHPTISTRQLGVCVFPELTNFSAGTWLRVTMPQIHYIENIAITMPVSERLGDIYVLAYEKAVPPSSADDGRLLARDVVAQAGSTLVYPLHATARYVWMRISENAHAPSVTALHGPVLSFMADESPLAPDASTMHIAAEIVCAPAAIPPPVLAQRISTADGDEMSSFVLTAK